MTEPKTTVSGFEARIMGVPDWIEVIGKVYGSKESEHEYAKFDAARTALGLACAEREKEVNTLFWKRSHPVCHIRLERAAFLAPLVEWATSRDGTTRELVLFENAWTEYLHLTFLGTSDAIVLPLGFSSPLPVGVSGRATPVPVCSAQRLLREIEIANTALNIEKTLRNPTLPDFFKAGRREVIHLEKKEGYDDVFWSKFAANVVRHLAKRCVDHNLPLIISDRSVDFGAA